MVLDSSTTLGVSDDSGLDGLIDIDFIRNNNAAGTDNDDFQITTAGKLKAKVAFDYSNPRDHNADNIYKVQVVASDECGNTTIKNIVIRVQPRVAPDTQAPV